MYTTVCACGGARTFAASRHGYPNPVTGHTDKQGQAASCPLDEPDAPTTGRTRTPR